MPRRRVWSLCLLFTLLLAVHVGQVHAIRNGTTIGGNNFFMYTDTADHIGTVSSIKYKRCIVTAGHVHNAMGEGKMIVAGDDLTTITDNHKRQEIAAATVSPDQTRLWVDFAILWLENKTDDGDLKRIPTSYYNPSTPQKAEDFGLDAGDTEVVISGYGDNDTVGGVNVGAGIKRSGQALATAFLLGSSQTPAQKGSIIGVEPVAAQGNKIACAGDSGGPLYGFGVPAGVYGVLAAGGDAALCKDVTTNTFSAFDDTNGTGGKTNWVRVNEMIKTTCGKLMNGGTSGDGLGKVEGTMSPGQESPPIDPDTYNQFNDTIVCGDGTDNDDCSEFMHEGQVMTLEAIAGEDSEFVKWVHGPPTHEDCPCVDSTDPTCVVEYDDMGYYDEDESYDLSGCYAEFEYVYGGGI